MLDDFEIEVDTQLLSDAFMQLVHEHELKINDKFSKSGIETPDELIWIFGLVQGLSENTLAGISKKNYECTIQPSTPNRLMKQYGLPKVLNIGNHNQMTFSVLYPEISKLYLLVNAQIAIYCFYDSIKKGEYDDCCKDLVNSILGLEFYRAELSKKVMQARKNACKAHKDDYILKDEVIEYWVKNIDPNLSNEKSAALLVKIFPIASRKASQYVAEAKRNILHLASKV